MTNLNHKINDNLGSLENIKKLQEEAVKYLQSSRMQNDEKEMWFPLLLHMDEGQLKNFIDMLKKENNEAIELYLTFLRS